MKEKITARLLAFSLLQYSLFIPLVRFVSFSILVAFISIIILVVLVLVNRSPVVSLPVSLLGVGLFLVILFKMLIGHAEFNTLFFVCIFVFPTLLTYLYPYDSEELLRYLIILSKIAFFVLVWIPFFSSFYRVYVSYMRFGYGMLPVVIFAYIDLLRNNDDKSNVKNRKWKRIVLDIIIIIVGFTEIFVFGSRGATFALIIFFAIDRVVYNQKRIVLNLFVFSGALLMYINITKIFSLVDLILNNVGIKSYAIMKFERQITRGFAAASSSRDSIYVEALRLIQKSPILGNTMSLDEEGGNYVHNVFLQVGQDLGVIALFVLVIFIVYALVQIGSKKKSVENRLSGVYST